MSEKPSVQKMAIPVNYRRPYRVFRWFPAALPAVAVLFFAFILVACRKPPIWIATWSTSQQLVEQRNLPPEPGLSNNTLRQVVRVSLGGDRLRARFSNEFSTSPVTLKAVHVAASTGNGTINPETDLALSFTGKTEITLEPGGTVMSDPFTFAVQPRSDVAITIYFGATSPDVTGHPGSRTTSYIVSGDAVSAVEMPNAARTDHWYVIDRIDVMAPASSAAVVTLGNSITDGRGSGTNKQNRWPDELAVRLRENPGTGNVAVLNAGIGGNCVLRDCLGPAALSRFERDVLELPGVRWLIILEGINDIGQVRGEEAAATLANDLIAAYEQMIEQAHAKGILVYGATLLPFSGSFYDSPGSQLAYKKVNEWIRNNGRFDAVIDLEAALHDPENPSQFLPAADTGDHLHPNETGHRMMAEAVDLGLLVKSTKQP